MRSDEIFPRFIVEGLPAGVSGIIIAGVFAAAMSTLSGSLNSLASSTMLDLYKPRWGSKNTPQQDLLISRFFTAIWGFVFIAGAMLFKDKENPVVELGLAIASFTYGGLLGTFFLGIFVKRAKEDDALIAIWAAIFFMTWVIGQQGVALAALVALNLAAGVWILTRIESSFKKMVTGILGAAILALVFRVDSPHLAWPWYVFVGCLVTLTVGTSLSLLKTPIKKNCKP